VFYKKIKGIKHNRKTSRQQLHDGTLQIYTPKRITHSSANKTTYSLLELGIMRSMFLQWAVP